MDSDAKATGLRRQLGLLGLAATGICSMLGAGINVVPFMIQRNVPGIGPFVLPAFAAAAIPALLAAISYAMLASAMPRAGGSYIYASRGLHPYLGFVASFSQWFGLSIAIGVVSYVTVPFIRDVFAALNVNRIATALEIGSVRVGIALALLWGSVLINVRGTRLYERILVPLMVLMFVLGAVVIVAGFSYDHDDFRRAIRLAERVGIPNSDTQFSLPVFLGASAVLFSSFIGFDSIAQAGGEAKNPTRTLPLAIGLAILVVGSFYFLFTAAVYHAVPWEFVADRAQTRDMTAPGMLGYLLAPSWTALIVLGAAVALANDLPAMLLSVSRLMFAWAEDGVFPAVVARVHARFHTPHVALAASGALATVSILGCHLAGDFFLGVDMLVTSMLFNFLVMCLTVLALPRRNPELAKDITVIRSRPAQIVLASAGALSLAALLTVQTWKDLSGPSVAWYFRSTPVWGMVIAVASGVFVFQWHRREQQGDDPERVFLTLPPE